jgi:hypothetical protein
VQIYSPRFSEPISPISWFSGTRLNNSGADLFRRERHMSTNSEGNGNKACGPLVEQPTKFEFNLKTTKQLGITIPPNILTRAHRLIR